MKRQFVFGTMLTAALAVSVGAQQAGQAGATGQDPARTGQERGGQTVTVTGCLQPANRAGGGQTAGDTTSRQSGQSGTQSSQYILTDATTSGAGATGTGTSGTGTTPGTATGTGATGTGSSTSGTRESASAGMRKSFRLVGGSDQNLQQYVNTRVAVTGTIQAGNRSGTGSGSTGAGTGAGTGTGEGTPTAPERPTGTGTGAGTGTGTGTGAGTGSTSSMTGSAGGNLPTLTVTSVRQVEGSCSGGDVR